MNCFYVTINYVNTVPVMQNPQSAIYFIKSAIQYKGQQYN